MKKKEVGRVRYFYGKKGQHGHTRSAYLVLADGINLRNNRSCCGA